MADQRSTVVLWRGKWLIVGSLAVAVALALLVTSRSAEVYQATATVQVNAATQIGQNGVTPADIQLANQSLAQTYATLIADRGFLQKVRPRILDGSLTAGEIGRRVSARAIANTSLVRLVAEGPSPAAARRLAADVAGAFISTVRSDAGTQTRGLQAEVQRQIADINRQIGRVEPTSERASSLRAARSELVRQLAALIAGSIAQGNSVSLNAPPTASSSATSPRPILNLVAGILLGLLVGVGLAFLRDRLDRGLHSAEEAEHLLDVPLLASIPERKRFSVDDPVLGEASKRTVSPGARATASTRPTVRHAAVGEVPLAASLPEALT